MNEEFFKFPSTPHLATLPGIDVRGDKVLSESECDDFLDQDLIIEEKIDGANLGISFNFEGEIQAQNRGNYLHLPASGQWKKLEQWLAPKINVLFEVLSDRFILFGEWCYAQHSIRYDQLPDWFLGFDIYDKQVGRFFSSGRRDDLLRQMNIEQVPFVARGHFSYPEVKKLLQSSSKFANHPAEGIYLRHDESGWLVERSKLVNAAFIDSMEQHWSRSVIKANRLCLAAHGWQGGDEIRQGKP